MALVHCKLDRKKEKGENAMLKAIGEILNELLKAHNENRNVNLNTLKTKICAKYSLKTTPRLVDIIAAIPPESETILKPKLLAKPIRTASGIAVIAVMCKPHRCPHINMTGNICVYCPGGPDSDFEYSTQSYTGYEPTSMRAIRARYDPFVQTKSRILQLEQLGHTVDKVEFIIMGGTFMSLPSDYRNDFILKLHDALTSHTSHTVAEAVMYSQRSDVKCIGMTIETRPDYCQRRHLSDMLSYGCTRLEVGVQSVYEDVARDTNRGHTVRAVTECFAMAKDTGFKVVSHMMPDLPNVGIERDLFQFKELFANPAFRPDGLKIYPTLVIRGTGLYELWKTGRYKSYPPDTLIDLIATILSLIPPWCRVYRVQRDIPMPLVTSGVEHGNLRELALTRMHDLGLKCRDVRTREVGIKEIHTKVRPENVVFLRRDYEANNGWETFLSFEDKSEDILIGLLRLRKCAADTFRPELKNASIIRELHVYGSAVPISTTDTQKFQHHGYGELLIEEAETITQYEHRSSRLAIISGIGTREYYASFGYHLDGPYMVKDFEPVDIWERFRKGRRFWAKTPEPWDFELFWSSLDAEGTTGSTDAVNPSRTTAVNTGKMPVVNSSVDIVNSGCAVEISSSNMAEIGCGNTDAVSSDNADAVSSNPLIVNSGNANAVNSRCMDSVNPENSAVLNLSRADAVNSSSKYVSYNHTPEIRPEHTTADISCTVAVCPNCGIDISISNKAVSSSNSVDYVSSDHKAEIRSDNVVAVCTSSAETVSPACTAEVTTDTAAEISPYNETEDEYFEEEILKYCTQEEYDMIVRNAVYA